MILPGIFLTTSLMAGCVGHSSQLQYDFGRASSAAFSAQADLNRPSVADSAYILTGVEAVEMRARVTDESTDQESGQAEAVQKIQVQ
jgi:hypothetical protein